MVSRKKEEGEKPPTLHAADRTSIATRENVKEGGMTFVCKDHKEFLQRRG